MSNEDFKFVIKLNHEPESPGQLTVIGLFCEVLNEIINGRPNNER